MFLFYVDESGTCSNDNQTNFFVLAAVAITDEHSSQIYRDISSLKQGILKKKKPEEWELKARDICQGLEYFKGWKWEARVRVFLEVSNTLNRLPCEIFAVIATALAVKPLCEAQLPLHLSDSRIELVVYEFDSLTMTNIAQCC